MHKPCDGLAESGRTGALVISLDFELIWGVRDRYPGDGDYRANLLGVRQAIPQMLNVFEEFEIAVTWATVGFLFAASRDELLEYWPTLIPTYADQRLSPYHEPLGATEAEDPLHYGASLLRAIMQRPCQEIATHTFSHYYCLEPGQTRDAFAADLASAAAIAHSYGVDLRSIVFPRNQANAQYLDLLGQYGITCYRGTEAGWLYRPRPTSRENALHIRGARVLDRYLNITGSNAQPWRDVLQPNGLCNVAASRFLRPYSPRWKRLDTLKLARIVGGIEAAAQARSIYHLWWHPHNFGVHTEKNIAFLRLILIAFTRIRKQYGMQSLTMAQVAQRAMT